MLKSSPFLFLLSLPEHIFQGGVLVIATHICHFFAVLIGENGEFGLWLHDEDFASIIVFSNALYAVASHHNAAFAVGTDENFIAHAVVDNVGAFVACQSATVLQKYNHLVFPLCSHAGDVEDGDELFFGGHEENEALIHAAVVPALVNG